jgi:hypothetical protein
MIAGTIKTGEPCELDEECISGACDIPFCGELCCTGVCLSRRAIRPLDAPCTRDDDCVADAFCSDAGTCVPLGDEGDLCRSDRQCAFGFGCIGPSEFMAGNCRKLGLLGEPCPYLRCAELGTTCQSGRCAAVGLPGAPCASAGDCSPFAHCDQTVARCAAIPTLGEPCTSQCGGESFCERVVTQSCVNPYENGTPCSNDEQCQSLFCLQGEFFDVCRDYVPCF